MFPSFISAGKRIEPEAWEKGVPRSCKERGTPFYSDKLYACTRLVKEFSISVIEMRCPIFDLHIEILVVGGYGKLREGRRQGSLVDPGNGGGDVELFYAAASAESGFLDGEQSFRKGKALDIGAVERMRGDHLSPLRDSVVQRIPRGRISQQHGAILGKEHTVHITVPWIVLRPVNPLFYG